MAARHDATDLRRLTELGITPLHWRRSLQRTGRVKPRAVIFIHDADGSSADSASRLLKDLLRAFHLAGLNPQLRGPSEISERSNDAVIVSLGVDAGAGKGGVDAVMLDLPSVAEMRGDATVKRKAWAAIRNHLRS
ncbi:MAG: hypothetical protein ABIR16_06950 [Dokdonella sp.]